MNKIIFNTNYLVINAVNAIKKKNYLEAKNLLEKALSINSELFEANYNLAILNFQLGNIDNSIVYFEKSKKLKPKSTQVFFNLALAYDRLNKLDLAIINFKKVSKFEPINELAFYNIGIMYKKKLDIIKAEKYFKKTLYINQNYVPAYDELFGLYESSNQLDKYNDLLDEAKKILSDQNLLKFYSAISHFHKKKYHDVIEIMENLELNKDNFHQNLTRHSFLAKSYDRIKNFDKAYYHFKINNELVNNYYGKNINEKIFINYVEKRLEFFKDIDLKNWKQFQIQNQSTEPTFLVGFPRSGTTLLDTILRTNNTVEVIEEKPILRNFLIELEKKTKSDFNHLGNLSEAYILEMRKFYFNERSKFQGNEKANLVIDKMPLNIIHIGEILRFFPNAKFIFALRNPYDCVLSCFIQQFTLNPAMKNFLTIESSALLYDLVMKLWKVYNKKFSINCHFIKYEDTVKNFENTTKDLFKYLELNWTDEAKNFFMNARKRIDISTPSHSQVISPLYTRSVDRWKNYEKEFEKVKKLLDPWVNEFNF